MVSLRNPTALCLLILAVAGNGRAQEAPEGPPELRFRIPEEIPTESLHVLRDERGLLGIECDRSLLPGGGEGRERIALSRAVGRIAVYGTRRLLCMLAGGVREDLSLQILNTEGRRWGIRLPRSRLLRGSFRPIVDEAGTVLALLHDGKEGVRLRVFELRGMRPRILLSRRLARPPERFALVSLLGDPWVRVVLGRVSLRAPGEEDFHEVAADGSETVFLHPSAAFPVCDLHTLRFGPEVSGEARELSLFLRNPGSLPLPLRFRIEGLRSGSLEVLPPSLILGPGERKKVVLRLASPGALRGRFLARGPTGAGEPFFILPVESEAAAREDRDPPRLDPSRIRLSFAPGNRVKIRGLPGAVRDAHMPALVGTLGGARTKTAADGSFELLAPRPMDGRISLWAEDGLGLRGHPVPAGRLLDREPPRWRPERVKMTPSWNGKVEIRGIPGALRDETPPIVLEVRVEGKPPVGGLPVSGDGSFGFEIDARPGDRIGIVARDGAVHANRGDLLPLGRALPYIEEVPGGAFLLRGPPGRGFLVTGRGETKLPPLFRLEGRFDLRGRARFVPGDRSGLLRLELDCLDPLRGLPLRATWPPEKKD